MNLKDIDVKEELFAGVLKLEHFIKFKINEHTSATLFKSGYFCIIDLSKIINAEQFAEISRIHSEIMRRINHE